MRNSGLVRAAASSLISLCRRRLRERGIAVAKFAMQQREPPAGLYVRAPRSDGVAAMLIRYGFNIEIDVWQETTILTALDIASERRTDVV